MTTSEPAVPGPVQDEDDSDDERVTSTGLASRKRMAESYRIMQQNDVERQGGNQDAFVSVRQIPRDLLMMLLMGRTGL